MLYAVEVEIPAQTSTTTPQVTTLALTEGVIKRIWLRWRFGAGNLCGVRLFYASFQYWPLTMGQWFPSTVYPLEFEERFPVQREPYTLKIETFNNDDIFSHTLWVAVLVMREEVPQELVQLMEYMRS